MWRWLMVAFQSSNLQAGKLQNLTLKKLTSIFNFAVYRVRHLGIWRGANGTRFEWKYGLINKY